MSFDAQKALPADAGAAKCTWPKRDRKAGEGLRTHIFEGMQDLICSSLSALRGISLDFTKLPQSAPNPSELLMKASILLLARKRT
jgi:hypothetical protein